MLTESDVIDIIETNAGVADYDSGWVGCKFGNNVFEHNLGTVEYTVYFWGAWWANDEWHYH